jgi:hypothetical protein
LVPSIEDQELAARIPAGCCIVTIRATRKPLPLPSAAGWEQKSWNVADPAAT